VTRGFLLGKFMPPHAGHVFLCDTARRLVDELTILVCWLPDDPIPGPLRLEWMSELFPNCRVLGFGEVAPQAPEENPEFWPIWRRIVKRAHPAPIDFVFAGERYGELLAKEVGARFRPVGARAEAGAAPVRRPISASRIRAAPWNHWEAIPGPVRGYFARTISLHGPESVGKTRLAARLAAHFETIWTPEYGRYYCEVHGADCTEADLLAIGDAQTAMIAASHAFCNRRLVADTDALMTAVWSEMMLDRVPDELMKKPHADLYLLPEIDVPWRNDGTRMYGTEDQRTRFKHISDRVVASAGVRAVRLSGSWSERYDAAVAAIEALEPPAIG
jgi:HTH-type transcriptional regulator, transcriptional repressor of NAD biosynthesis genes